jgi:hypothetical protein
MGTNNTYLAPKGIETIAQGFNPGLTAMKRRALKALPTPRPRGAIPNWRSTPTLRYSITPRGRIRGRGRRRGQPARRSLWFVDFKLRWLTKSGERSASRAAPELGLRLPQTIECWPGYRPWIWCPFRAHRLKTPNPGLKPWAEIYCPFGAKTSSPERFINGGQFVTCAIGTNTNEC